jgi:hypothetical protein
MEHVPPRRGLAPYALLLLLSVLAACPSSGGPEAPDAAVPLERGDYCYADAGCKSGICLQFPDTGAGTCSIACTTDTDCAPEDTQTVCGIGPAGEQACVPICGGAYGSYACVGGLSTACTQVPDDTHCIVCGCPENLRCEPGAGCMPKSEVGGNCLKDEDCRTGNCSTFAGVCRVPVGQPCDESNCDRCLTAPNGWSFCSRECDSQNDCNGGQCIGHGSNGFFTCRPSCSSFADPTCPGSNNCEFPSGGNELFCDCESGGDCPIVAPMRTLGQNCNLDSECASGSCVARLECGGPFGDECVDRGLCSQSCDSDADCGGGACVAVPCVDGQAGECGFMCLPRCGGELYCDAYQTCTALAGVSGSNQLVCDVRIGDGLRCADNASCQSGNCVNRMCAPTGGLGNGEVCGQNGDCRSHSCISGHCRGGGLLGDACSIPADCAAGTCCPAPSGSGAGTCASSC